jgi:hypothetical protein
MNTQILFQTSMIYQTIVDRITRIHRNKPINEGDIIEWVSECETDYIQDVENMIGYSGLRLEVKNKRALLPCNVYRILKVYTDRKDRTSDVNYIHVKRWINLPGNYDKDYIYLDYYGLRIDENGLPEVAEGHLPALVAFCIHYMYYEDWIAGKIDGSRWQFIYEDMVNKVRDVANGFRNINLEDLNSLHYIQFNMVPKIGTMQFSIDDVDTHFLEQ